MICVGQPILVDGAWSLVEKIFDDFHTGLDEFVYFCVLRHADGTQSRILLRDLYEQTKKS